MKAEIFLGLSFFVTNDTLVSSIPGKTYPGHKGQELAYKLMSVDAGLLAHPVQLFVQCMHMYTSLNFTNKTLTGIYLMFEMYVTHFN